MSKIKNGSILDEELSLRQIEELTNINYKTVQRMLERREIKSKKVRDVVQFIKETERVSQ